MIRKDNRGFTLIEVVVAVAILAIGIVAVSDVFSISLRSLRAIRDNMDLSIVALSEMRTILQSPALEEGTDIRMEEDYIIETLIEEREAEKTEGLPYKLFNITVTIRKTGKLFALRTQKLIKTVFK